MCHVSRLSAADRTRLRQMDAEHRNRLEYALENGVDSTRAAVKPVFERIYASWVEVEAARAALAAISERDAALTRALEPVTPEAIGAAR